MALTGTNVPARILVSRGVIKIAPKVEHVVISTDRATSPLPMKVATLEACVSETRFAILAAVRVAHDVDFAVVHGDRNTS